MNLTITMKYFGGSTLFVDLSVPTILCLNPKHTIYAFIYSNFVLYLSP